ncbi:hypothetical protein PARMER_02723 [Parabacteroides merdae ATCC 43184]|nr:hypothetical protein PARMER_02723 [Parabacteroides merdae ATCC 43184]
MINRRKKLDDCIKIRFSTKTKSIIITIKLPIHSLY